MSSTKPKIPKPPVEPYPEEDAHHLRDEHACRPERGKSELRGEGNGAAGDGGLEDRRHNRDRQASKVSSYIIRDVGLILPFVKSPALASSNSTSHSLVESANANPVCTLSCVFVKRMNETFPVCSCCRTSGGHSSRRRCSKPHRFVVSKA